MIRPWMVGLAKLAIYSAAGYATYRTLARLGVSPALAGAVGALALVAVRGLIGGATDAVAVGLRMARGAQGDTDTRSLFTKHRSVQIMTIWWGNPPDCKHSWGPWTQTNRSVDGADYRRRCQICGQTEGAVVYE